MPEIFTNCESSRYSAEVAGTIIVQCVPILRPLLRDIHTGWTSKPLGDTEVSQTATWKSRRSTMTGDSKRRSNFLNGDGNSKKGTEEIALKAIKEEPWETVKGCNSSSLLSETDQSIPAVPAEPLFGDTWRIPGIGHTDIPIPLSNSWLDLEQDGRKGLSPAPPKASS